MVHAIRRITVRTLALLGLAAAAITLASCKKTGEGEYEVERPTMEVDVGRTADTIRTPDVDVGTTTDTLVVKRPTIETNPPPPRNP
jgi:hypothetical protein